MSSHQSDDDIEEESSAAPQNSSDSFSDLESEVPVALNSSNQINQHNSASSSNMTSQITDESENNSDILNEESDEDDEDYEPQTQRKTRKLKRRRVVESSDEEVAPLSYIPFKKGKKKKQIKAKLPPKKIKMVPQLRPFIVRSKLDPSSYLKKYEKILSEDRMNIGSHPAFICINFDPLKIPNSFHLTTLTAKILDSNFDSSFDLENVKNVFSGISSIKIYPSYVPTLSILEIKTEEHCDNADGKIKVPSRKNNDKRRELVFIGEKFHFGCLDFGDTDLNMIRGLCNNGKYFYIQLCKFESESCEFEFDIFLVESAIWDEHGIEEAESKKSSSSLLKHTFEIILNLPLSINLSQECRIENKEKDDIEWFYGQVKKYHLAENMPQYSQNLQHPTLVPILRPYQLQGVNWMLCRENAVENYDCFREDFMKFILNKLYVPLYSKYVTKDNYNGEVEEIFYSPYLNYFCFKRPKVKNFPTGGILADEMGLGKTVEVLALILLNPKKETQNPNGKNVVKTQKIEKNKKFPVHPKMRKKREMSPCEFESKNFDTPHEEKSDKIETLSYSTDMSPPNEEHKLNESLTKAQKSTKTKAKKSRNTKRGRKNLKRLQKSKEILPKQTESQNAVKKDVKNVAKKETLYSKVKILYESALSEYSSAHHASIKPRFRGEFFEPCVRRMDFFECFCGDNSTRYGEILTCVKCSSSQHASCVGYDMEWAQTIEYLCPHCTIEGPKFEAKSTLIITPNTIAHQWIQEIQRHIKNKHLKILFYKGVSKHGYMPPSQLGSYDLVITTYGVLSDELNYVDLPHSNSSDGRKFRGAKRYLTIPSTLPSVHWWRICLDEAQLVEGLSTKMCIMASKLSGVHRWAITGTPISKSLEGDLLGLFIFLNIPPFTTPFLWNALVSEPFRRKETSVLYQLFGSLIWRVSKNDVLDQLGIPPQSQIAHWLHFSPVEKHFYNRHFENITPKIHAKIQKIEGRNAQGLQLRLSHIERTTLHDLLIPFLDLRQACCHPQTLIGKAHSIYLRVSETLTMEELLQHLIKKNIIQCTDDQRLIFSALNGAAGIHWLLNQFFEASEKYREILHLASKYENILKPDTFQILHTLENLSDLLDMNVAGVPYTLRDDKLRGEAEEMKKKYLAEQAAGVKSTYKKATVAHEETEKIYKEFKKVNEPWWLEVIYIAARENRLERLIERIRDSIAYAYATKKSNEGPMSKVRTAESFKNVLSKSLSDIDVIRTSVQWSVSNLNSTHSIEELVGPAMECHLRKKGQLGSYLCPLCLFLNELDNYRDLIYTSDRGEVKKMINRTGRKWQKNKIAGGRRSLTTEEESQVLLQEADDLAEVTGQLNLYKQKGYTNSQESHTEKTLKLLLNFAKTTLSDEDIFRDGQTHIKLFESLKKEHKALKAYSNDLFEQVARFDELSQVKTRIQLAEPSSMSQNAPTSSKGVKNPRKIPEFYNHELHVASKLESIHLISHFETGAKLRELESEIVSHKADFSVHYGQLVYLKQLENSNWGRKGVRNNEECPVCAVQLGVEWCVLICGHSFCTECVKKLCPNGGNGVFLCPLCREGMRIGDVSFVDTKITNESPVEVAPKSVRGSHSTKIEGIIETLLKLKVSHPGEKVVIFSTWNLILEILRRGLLQNDILFADLNASGSKKDFHKILDKFKKTEDVQVLLLPLNAGSKGLNIIEATHVFLVEPILNNASELQAIGRIHRIGQTKPTFVHRFYVKDTIEEHLYEILKNQDVCSDDEGFLTLGDLKNLVTKI